MESFVGCNCYYLLEKAIESWDPSKGLTGSMVEKTLKEIRDPEGDAGFTVVRMWGFHSDNSDGKRPLQTTPQDPGNYNSNASEVDQMKALGIDDKRMQSFYSLLDLAKEHKLKLMICLTNSLADYGGMPQFVRWATKDGRQLKDIGRDEFFRNEKAQAHCKNYFTFIVNHINKHMQDNNYDCVHSWDICNEPRNPGTKSADVMAKWVRDMSQHVKNLDSKHLVTVGSEGFWGKDNDAKNPYPGTADEGCDWNKDLDSDDIDFVCIHPYGDQWGHKHDALTFNKDWIKTHMAACKGKKLVLQEYNLPESLQGEHSKDRIDYYDFVKKQLLEPGSTLVGAMVWMAADRSYKDKENIEERYNIYPDSPEWKKQKDMCAAVNRPVTT